MPDRQAEATGGGTGDARAQSSHPRAGIEALFHRLEQLNDIGASLSRETDISALLEKILVAAKTITRADAGTLYRVDGEGDARILKFEIMRTASLGIAMGGTTGQPIPFYPIQLFHNGRPNDSMVAAYAALTGETVNIADAYAERGFDFSGTRAFDAKTGYRSKSFLTVPMRNHEGDIIGVLQLINATDPVTGAIQPFDDADRRLAESLASQAAIALTNRQLINQLEDLFESFIRLINEAIDEKSPYTGGHCQRVPALTMMLAEAAHDVTTGPLRDFRMSDRDRFELHIAGMLHDCGKITTPVHVVDKSTKLETIFDRITLIDARFEVVKQDARIRALTAKLAVAQDPPSGAAARLAVEADIDRDLVSRLSQIDDDRDYLRRCNIGGEAMSADDIARVRRIAAEYRVREGDGRVVPFLTPDEVENLTVPKGTLTAEERAVINRHIVSTIRMLEALPWPRHLRNVPEYAGGHHERMDGKGYPRGLTGEQMSVQARAMAIADIFEALTAKDRPYKPAKTLSESLAILGRFCLDGHIDPHLFDVFVRARVYERYAREFLDPEQIDAVDEARIPGFAPQAPT